MYNSDTVSCKMIIAIANASVFVFLWEFIIFIWGGGGGGGCCCFFTCLGNVRGLLLMPATFDDLLENMNLHDIKCGLEPTIFSRKQDSSFIYAICSIER